MKTGIKNSIVVFSFLGVFASTLSVVSAGYFNTDPIYHCDQAISRTLQVGSQNNDVYVLQQFLARAGYLYATPNGNFGPATKRAVKSFQQENYIRSTGIVGEQTRNALNERMCDTDTSAYLNDYYDYSSGVTYVDGYDPFAVVVSPTPSSPAVYKTPQPRSNSYTYNSTNVGIIPQVTSGSIVSSNSGQAVSGIVTPVTAQVDRTSVVYTSGAGYILGVTPKVQSLTVTSPSVNALYNEGDSVIVSWTTNNLNAAQYILILENKITKQSKTVAVTSGSSASFVLTKELLDAVCAGVCDNSQQGAFSIVITTPVTDIAGVTSTFRATVSPITIKRPYGAYGFGAVSITASRNPVNSNENFKLYINIPTGASWNNGVYGNYTLKIHVTCPSGVTVSVAGAECGQDFTIPFAPSYFQQEIPVVIRNGTWYRQSVAFDLIVATLSGQIIGTSQSSVSVNGAPYSW
jgi:peptidoglycan hydrolase-like protein with peptidoglycan-binding domain